MKNNGKVCNVRSLECKIKVLNGHVPETWKWTIPLRISTEICRLGRGTVSTNGNADYLLENLSCEVHKNVVN